VKTEQRIAIFVKKERRQPKAWELCPRSSFCNISKCPLYEDYNYLFNDPSDPAMKSKQKCVDKKTRKQIGEYFNLENRGLTNKEFAGFKKWESLTEKERIEKSKKKNENSPFVSLKSKGYEITRLSKDKTPVTLLNQKNTPIDTPQDTLSQPEKQSGFPNQIQEEAEK